ncbi:hypothetical protein FNF27_06107 [Cafeteria roenbergensis]|uniref:Ribosomal protein L32 n=3 Tax=Cafeteria roenbergensis TaxID=33653 RepID=A0A5A8E4M0_CAFRO|nr:hypothetical protein FNF27_06107 [Cafeteria roenbergensis]
MAVRAAMFGIRVSSAAALARHAGASWLAAASTAVRSASAPGRDDALPFALEGAMASTSGSDMGSSAAADPLEVFRQALWLAVPKRKKSYSRKRMRQMDSSKQAVNKQHFYPCPNCDEGWLKLRHHLCVCAMKKLRIPVPKRDKVRYADFVNQSPEDSAELGPSAARTTGTKKEAAAAKGTDGKSD